MLFWFWTGVTWNAEAHSTTSRWHLPWKSQWLHGDYVNGRTNGRTVRTFRRRRQLHPPKPFFAFASARLSACNFFFSLYTQRFAPSIFCFVIRPVTVEVGKRTVKEGAGSCVGAKKKGDDVNGTNCKNQYLCMYRFSQLVCKKKRALVPLSFTNFFSSYFFFF